MIFANYIGFGISIACFSNKTLEIVVRNKMKKRIFCGKNQAEIKRNQDRIIVLGVFAGKYWHATCQFHNFLYNG